MVEEVLAVRPRLGTLPVHDCYSMRVLRKERKTMNDTSPKREPLLAFFMFMLVGVFFGMLLMTWLTVNRLIPVVRGSPIEKAVCGEKR